MLSKYLLERANDSSFLSPQEDTAALRTLPYTHLSIPLSHLDSHQGTAGGLRGFGLEET